MACVVDTANQPELQSSPMAFSASNMLIPASMSEYIAANPSGQRVEGVRETLAPPDLSQMVAKVAPELWTS